MNGGAAEYDRHNMEGKYSDEMDGYRWNVQYVTWQDNSNTLSKFYLFTNWCTSELS